MYIQIGTVIQEVSEAAGLALAAAGVGVIVQKPEEGEDADNS